MSTISPPRRFCACEYGLIYSLQQMICYLIAPLIGDNKVETPSTKLVNPSTTTWKSVTNITMINVTKAIKKNRSILSIEILKIQK
jgi:CO dehydrogenase/acetyl-CoA synthase delta subunit